MKRFTAWFGGGVLLTGFFLLHSPAYAVPREEFRSPGWGIDAVLSNHVKPDAVDEYIDLLRGSGVVWVRERGLGPVLEDDESAFPLDTAHRKVWRKLKTAGFRVVAFSSAFRAVPVAQRGNQLPENLLDIYAAAFELGYHTLGEVDAFEMVGEPDATYCRDLPDRVAAFQKATYLGIKDGAAAAILKGMDSRWPALSFLQADAAGRRRAALATSRVPLVLTGAMAFPPGNWLDLAAANGLYEYSDAVNYHHYGFAKDLGPAVKAHREFAALWSGRGELPVWITEAGLNNIRPGRWNHPEDRRAQAEYLTSCAKAAQQAGVVVFMPFILVHDKDPFAMTESASKVFPSWTEYRALTRNEPLNPGLPLASIPRAPSRFVLQWVPDNQTCRPYKPGGVYCFRPDRSMEGKLFLYNFSDAPAELFLRQIAGNPVVSPLNQTTEGAWTIQVGSHQVVEVPVEIPRPPTLDYFRETIRFSVTSQSAANHRRPVASVEFRIGSALDDTLPQRLLTIPWSEEPPTHYISEESSEPQITGVEHPWTGWNGITFPETPSESASEAFVCSLSIGRPGPLDPPMLAARVNHLPGSLDRGFLRLSITDAAGRTIGARVDLIDKDGQRFSIVENLGRPIDRPRQDPVMLAYSDFHPWVFGRVLSGKRLEPANIREIQIRLYDGQRDPKTISVRLAAGEFSDPTGL